MTEISFHFNAADQLEYACRLLRKATGRGAKVVVTAETDVLRKLDLALWSFSPLEFIAHCGPGEAAQSVLSRSPVVLSDEPRAAPHQQLLVNLGGAVPQGFERFERLIEVVTQGDDDRSFARQRWKHYADRGYAIARHDLAVREGQ